MSEIIDSLYNSLEAAPHNWSFRLGLIEALQVEGRTGEIHNLLTEVTELPSDPESLVMAGQAYGVLEPDNGIEVLNSVIASMPAFAPAYLEKAKLLLNKGDVQDATAQYTTATSLDPALDDPNFTSQLSLLTQQPSEVEPLLSPVSVDPSEYHEPQPGENPTSPVSQVVKPVPLVDPNSIPDQPELVYEEVTQLKTQYTESHQFLERLNNVDVHSAHYEQPVAYDYQQPNEEIFAPTLSADQICVAAAETEDGELVAPLHDMIISRSEERQRRNKAIATQNKIVSFCVAVLTIAIVCVAMWYIVSELPKAKQPQLVASAESFVESTIKENVVEKEQVQQTPVAPPVSFDVATSASSSSFSVANFDVPSTDFAMSATPSFESSMTFGGASGKPVSFFGSSSASSKVVFVVDASLSMRAKGKGSKVTKEALMKKELIKTINALPADVDFQILFFSGPSWFLDLSPVKSSKDSDPQAAIKQYNRGLEKRLLKDWKALGRANFWEYKGGNPENWPKVEYIRSTPSNRRMAAEMIKGTPMLLGTDWRDPLKMAMKMEPDTIYFMTDGAVGKHPSKKPVVDDVLAFNRKHSKATINTICMMVLQASDKLQELADKTRGEFVLVKEDGTSVTGFELDRLIRNK